MLHYAVACCVRRLGPRLRPRLQYLDSRPRTPVLSFIRCHDRFVGNLTGKRVNTGQQTLAPSPKKKNQTGTKANNGKDTQSPRSKRPSKPRGSSTDGHRNLTGERVNTGQQALAPSPKKKNQTGTKTNNGKDTQSPRSKRPSKPRGSSTEGHDGQLRQPLAHNEDMLSWAGFMARYRGARTEHGSLAAQSEFTIPRLIKELELPTEEQYPMMPTTKLAGIYTAPKQALDKAGRRLGIDISYETIRMTRLELPHTAFYRSTVTVRIPGRNEVVAVGDAYTKPYAEAAASIHTLAKLHKAGLLAMIWRDPAVPGEKEKREGNGVYDIFNYAARYGCVPEYAVEKIGRFFSLKIQMPEHGIDVAAFGSSIIIAELRASLGFKRQAENYQKQEGTDSLIVKDKTSLSVDNAHDFLMFCDAAGEGRAVVQTVEVSSSFKSMVVMNGKTLAPPVLISRGGKRNAERIARLIAAVSLAKEKPRLWEDFRSKFLLTGTKFVSPTARPAELVLMPQTLEKIIALNRSTANFIEERGNLAFQRHEQAGPVLGRSRRRLTGSALKRKSIALQLTMASYQNRPDLEVLRHTRSQLPMNQYAHQVREIVNNNIYCVIVGATGSGKTTQVPQILLDQAIENGTGASCNVVCTQPRRIAATSVARRVADERAEQLQDTVGYHVRFDVKPPRPSGSILFCTTGVLLQQLRVDHDEVYDRVSHLVIDEVHERDIVIDFLLIMIKKTMTLRVAQGRTIPRVVLMSATIDAKRFAEYFRGTLRGPFGTSTNCPTLSVPGRTFPVKEHYLTDVLQELKREHGPAALRLWTSHDETRDYLATEVDTSDNHMPKPIIDWNGVGDGRNDEMVVNKKEALVPLGLAAATVAHLAKTTAGGAILVFLPGLDHITKLNKMLRNSMPLGVDFNNERKFRIFMLHSSINDQKTVFDPIPDGCRKLILSTNIAETSVTIPEVQFVVDTGKAREKQYDQTRRMTQLQCTWISKSNIKQRAGRAGRVQNGNYYALYTKSRFESMRAVGLPELLRSELLEVCLDVKAQRFQMPVRDFLAEAIEPPPGHAVDSALESLKSLGALTKKEELTPLGRLLASLPVHPALGKMIVLGIIFRCLEPMVIIGAAAGERSLIMASPTELFRVDRIKERLAGPSNSDHIMLLEAFNLLRKAESDGFDEYRRVCEENCLHPGVFKSIQSNVREILDILWESGLITTHDQGHGLQYGGQMLNENSRSHAVIKALLLAGLYPNIAIQKPNLKSTIFRTRYEYPTAIHNSSVNSRVLDKRVEGQQLLTFTNLALAAEGHRINMRDTTFITPLMAVLFGGQLSVDPIKHCLKLDEWLVFFINRVVGKIETQEPAALANQILLLRQKLDTMLAITFNDLARKKPLADDDARTRLANGVATILQLNAPEQSGFRRLATQAAGVVSSQSQLRDTSQQRRYSLPENWQHPPDRRSSSSGWRSL